MEKLFEYYINGENFHFKYAKGKPAVENKEYHDYNEFVFFISGNASFISKNIQQKLKNGSIVMIPKEHFHQFCVKDQNNYVRCILGFYETPELKKLVSQAMNTVKIIDAPNAEIISLFENLIKIAESNLSDEEKSIFAKGSLMHLTVYCKNPLFKAISSNLNLSPVVSRSLEIIDEQYKNTLTVEDIAKQLFVSYSTLTHKFREEMNIPIYRYITKKRLAEAHKLINQGKTLIFAAQNSGFTDYSGFYRLYKKYYGQ